VSIHRTNERTKKEHLSLLLFLEKKEKHKKKENLFFNFITICFSLKSYNNNNKRKIIKNKQKRDKELN
jgi:hypothetical protein